MRSNLALRVLLIENDSLLRFFTEAQLFQLGCQVVGHAATAEGAVTIAELTRPDVVLMDVQLDGERDGIAAALEIRSTLAIPSVFVSGGITVVQEQALATMGSVYLAKPLQLNVLGAALLEVRLALDRSVEVTSGTESAAAKLQPLEDDGSPSSAA